MPDERVVTDEVTNEIVDPEVTEETPEEIAEEVLDETPEELQEEGEAQEEEEPFDPEKVQFKDDELYQIEGFDLSKHKELIDLSNPETLQLAESQLKDLKGRGFTQDQIDFLIDNAINDLQSEQNQETKPKTAKEVTEHLNKNLDKETRLGYVPLTRNLKEWVTGSKYEKHFNQMTKDPDFLNLINHLSKKIKGEPAGTGNNLKHETGAGKMTAQIAKQNFNRFLTSEKNTGLEAQRKEITRLESLCISKDEFKEEFVGLI